MLCIYSAQTQHDVLGLWFRKMEQSAVEQAIELFRPIADFFCHNKSKGTCGFWIAAWMSKKQQQSNCVWVVDGANQQRGGVLVSMICFCFFCNYLDFVLACKVRLLWRCILQNKENFWIVFWKVRIMFALLAFWCCFFRSMCLESTSYGRMPGHIRGKKKQVCSNKIDLHVRRDSVRIWPRTFMPWWKIWLYMGIIISYFHGSLLTNQYNGCHNGFKHRAIVDC